LTEYRSFSSRRSKVPPKELNLSPSPAFEPHGLADHDPRARFRLKHVLKHEPMSKSRMDNAEARRIIARI
jgi:hypothetical protein